MKAPKALIWALFLMVLPIGAAAQTSGTSNVRTEVLAFVRSFTDAANRADVAAVMEMYDHSPNLISAENGEITRGWEAVRDDANQMLGKEGLYKISTGSFDVISLGAGRALAIGPVVATVQTEGGPLTFDQVVTLVLEKKQGKWVITHEHTSTKQQGD